jgi:hypothetical protein
MAVERDHLLVHADAEFYLERGRSIDEVNRAFGELFARGDPREWDRLFADFSQRMSFSGDDGPTRARRFMSVYGGKRIVHGHTPIPAVISAAPDHVTKPLIYADDLCVNVDGGMFCGGPGFIHELA